MGQLSVAKIQGDYASDCDVTFERNSRKSKVLSRGIYS